MGEEEGKVDLYPPTLSGVFGGFTDEEQLVRRLAEARGVANPFSGSSQCRSRTGVSCIAGRFFTN